MIDTCPVMTYFTKITIKPFSTAPILSPTEERSFWLQWSPSEVIAGRGLTVGAQIMDSASHFAPQEDVYQMFVETEGPWANVTIHVDL